MDPIANMLVAVKNAYMAKKESVILPYSGFKFRIAKILEQEKFTGEVVKKDNQLIINLIYENQEPKIKQIKRVSKLGLRVYTRSKNIKSLKGGRGLTIISTPQGVMSGADAKVKKLGGEVICQIW